MGYNLVIMLIIALIFLVLWVIFELKDYLVKKHLKNGKKHCCKRRHAYLFSNALLRIAYLFWLELCICAFLTVSWLKEEASGSSFQWYCAMGVILAMISLSLLFALAFCRKNADGAGSSIVGFYMEKTWWKS